MCRPRRRRPRPRQSRQPPVDDERVGEYVASTRPCARRRCAQASRRGAAGRFDGGVTIPVGDEILVKVRQQVRASGGAGAGGSSRPIRAVVDLAPLELAPRMVTVERLELTDSEAYAELLDLVTQLLAR